MPPPRKQRFAPPTSQRADGGDPATLALLARTGAPTKGKARFAKPTAPMPATVTASARPAASPAPPGAWKDSDTGRRDHAIRERNRVRRYPWVPAVVAVALGLAGYGVAGFLRWAWQVPAGPVATGVAALPVVTALVVAATHRRTHARWTPELAAAGVGAGAVAGWIAAAGVSWWVILVLLVGTLLLGRRWWVAHPIGPGVPPVIPAGTRRTAPSEADPYPAAWAEHNAAQGGKAPGSRLTGRVDTTNTREYSVELKRGAQTVGDLHANRASLAGGLGEDTDRVLFKRGPRGAGAHTARLTIITRDPVAEVRYFTGPLVQDGVIKGVARYVDGSGDADLAMWGDEGMVATMITGSTGGGKSGAANLVTCNALSTGLLNLLYADPKGNSSTALASRARVAVIGKANVLQLPRLIAAMLAARGTLAANLGADQILPTHDIPGWMWLHDEYSLIASDPRAKKVWTETVNTVRAYGVWAVALNQSLGVPQWGDDHARSAFASQVVAFGINSKSSNDLVPGLVIDPAELPRGDDGRPIPGHAVHAWMDTPARWDFLPSDANAALMADKGHPAPPYTTSSAFDTFFNQPDPDPLDVAAIEAILGPAVNGRWQVGGKGATHRFPDPDSDTPPAEPAVPRGRWGQRGDGLTGSQHEVLALVRSGITDTATIVARADAGRSTVMEALAALVASGRVQRTEHGVYLPT